MEELRGGQGRPRRQARRFRYSWDWRYYNNRQLKEQYQVDDFAVAEYFPLEACLEGLFDVTQTLLGVRFEHVPDAPAWHPDVEGYDIYEAGGSEPIARFYMDLFPRPNTFSHAAAFPIRRGRQLPDGSYQRPVSAIVANFTKPGPERPSLLRHQEVITLFHEFGHIMHQCLSNTRCLRFQGTATERDFVEAPSQMLEHWCWDRDVLQRFAQLRTGARCRADTIDRMVGAKTLNSGVFYTRQLFFATLDFTYHSPGFEGDTDGNAGAAARHHGLPVHRGDALPVGLRAPVRVRRGVLRLPVVARVRGRHVHALRGGGAAGPGGRPRIPGAHPGAGRLGGRRRDGAELPGPGAGEHGVPAGYRAGGVTSARARCR
ncbi:MAG: M3 family metallopeptidase [Dehalococcoidia bacterium]|nr:M3 family metallopeptidase [Dehalococcoidia bacterium]